MKSFFLIGDKVFLCLAIHWLLIRELFITLP